MPLPFALPLGLLMGLTLAWLARGELARSEVALVLARPFLVALGLGVLVYAPVVGYFLWFHGDWAWLYLVRTSRIPSAVDLGLVLLAGASVPAGFAGAVPFASGKRGAPLFKVGAAIGGVVLVAGALVARRLAVSATYTQFHAGFGLLPASHTSLGRGILLSWLTLLVAYGWSANVLKRASR